MTDATVKKTSDWAISSQAAEGSVEGSTTSAWSPERTVKRHECGACKQKRTKPVYETGLGKHFDELVQMAEQGMTSTEIAAHFGAKTKTVSTYCRRHGIKLFRPEPKVKEVKENTYHKGFITTHNGYIMVSKPDHPHADSKGYVRLHRLVMEEHLGRIIEKSDVVHHINGDKADNRIENLEVICKRRHASVHARKGETGWAVYHANRKI